MRREVLLIAEMIEAATEARTLVFDADLIALSEDRQRRDALLWNFTVLGETASQLDEEVKRRFPDVTWKHRVASRTAGGRVQLRL